MTGTALRMEDDTEREIARLEHELTTLKRRMLDQRSAVVFGAPLTVRGITRARRVRDDVISPDLFADPAWDILLELYAADLDQKRVSTSELCMAAAVPATTALRWIDKLDQMGFLARDADPLDRRRIWVALSPLARSKMQSYFEALPAALWAR